MGTRDPSPQTSKGWRLEASFPWIFALSENAFVTEAETVSAGTKFIVRHSTATSGGAHRETACSAETEARQRCTPGEKGCGHRPSVEDSEEAVKSFIKGGSSMSLSSFRPIICFLFPHLTYARTLP